MDGGRVRKGKGRREGEKEGGMDVRKERWRVREGKKGWEGRKEGWMVVRRDGWMVWKAIKRMGG
eukprot:152114-Chlamydomonas_euryale.AAC.1